MDRPASVRPSVARIAARRRWTLATVAVVVIGALVSGVPGSANPARLGVAALASITFAALAVGERTVGVVAMTLALAEMGVVLRHEQQLMWHDGLLDLVFVVAVATVAGFGYISGTRWARAGFRNDPL